MKVFTENASLQATISELKLQQKKVGLVPTMGALHEGHMALVNRALLKNDVVVVSIFVNPTQFNNADDLKNYPRTLDADIKLLEQQSGEILVYAPTVEDIYQGKTNSENFDFSGLENEMEGKFRRGHFDGVGTVVKRLFEIIKPHNAYFGEKDFQQLMIIRKLVSKYQIPVNIVGCKILRESSGLAMSSRNARLNAEEKMAAPFIYKTMKTAKKMFGTESANKVVKWVEEQFAKHKLLQLEYFIIANTKTLKQVKRKSRKKDYRAFTAAYAGDIRLIDNIALN